MSLHYQQETDTCCSPNTARGSSQPAMHTQTLVLQQSEQRWRCQLQVSGWCTRHPPNPCPVGRTSFHPNRPLTDWIAAHKRSWHHRRDLIHRWTGLGCQAGLMTSAHPVQRSPSRQQSCRLTTHTQCSRQQTLAQRWLCPPLAPERTRTDTRWCWRIRSPAARCRLAPSTAHYCQQAQHMSDLRTRPTPRSLLL